MLGLLILGAVYVQDGPVDASHLEEPRPPLAEHLNGWQAALAADGMADDAATPDFLEAARVALSYEALQPPPQESFLRIFDSRFARSRRRLRAVSEAAAEAGDARAAIEPFLIMARFAKKLRRGARGPGDHVLADLALETACKGLLALRAKIQPDRELLREVVSELGRLRPVDEDLAHRFELAHWSAARHIDEIIREVSEDLAKGDGPDELAIPAWAYWQRYHFQRNNTLSLSRDLTRAAIRRLPRPARLERAEPARPFLVWTILEKNTVGQALIEELSEDCERAKRRHRLLRARLELVRVVYAAEAFRLSTGRFPARLEELVPAELSALPRDPFTEGSLELRLGAGVVRAAAAAGIDMSVSLRAFGEAP